MEIKNLTISYKNGVLNGYSYDLINEKESKEIGIKLKSPVFEEVIYKDNVKEMMKLIISKCKVKTMNLLLYGGQGVGKSFSGKMLAVELDKNFVFMNGSMGKQKIIDILTNLKANSLVLVDEIHSWSLKSAEIIYPAIQDNEIVINGKSIKLDCMFVATTTEPHLIPKPLLDRFKQIELEELTGNKLKELLKLKGLTADAIELLLNHSTNLRVINNLIELMDLYGDKNKDNLLKVFRLKKINENGLSDLQEKYLLFLKSQSKPVGLRIICLYLKKSEEYVKLYVEDELIRKNMVLISSRGREFNYSSSSSSSS